LDLLVGLSDQNQHRPVKSLKLPLYRTPRTS